MTRSLGRRGFRTPPCRVPQSAALLSFRHPPTKKSLNSPPCSPPKSLALCLGVDSLAYKGVFALSLKRFLRLGAAFFAIVNAYFLTRGLQHYEAFFMITTVEGSMILSASLSGAIVLLDVRHLEAWRICMYSLCVLLVISGMITVFRGEASSKSSLMSGNASTLKPIMIFCVSECLSVSALRQLCMLCCSGLSQPKVLLTPT